MCVSQEDLQVQHEMHSQRAVSQLQRLQSYRDEEEAHRRADDVLLELLGDLGYEEVVEAYLGIPRWYS